MLKLLPEIHRPNRMRNLIVADWRSPLRKVAGLWMTRCHRGTFDLASEPARARMPDAPRAGMAMLVDCFIFFIEDGLAHNPIKSTPHAPRRAMQTCNYRHRIRQ